MAYNGERTVERLEGKIRKCLFFWVKNLFNNSVPCVPLLLANTKSKYRQKKIKIINPTNKLSLFFPHLSSFFLQQTNKQNTNLLHNYHPVLAPPVCFFHHPVSDN